VVVAELTAAGLLIKTLDEYRADLGVAWRGAFGQSMVVDDTSPDGQILGILAERFALVDERLEQIAAAMDPRNASGSLLEALCALTGTIRAVATFSTVTLTLAGTPTTVIPAGRLFSTASTGQQFTTLDAATIDAGAAWSTGLAVALGEFYTSSGNLYEVVDPGGSATTLAPGPSGTSKTANVTDPGGVVWRFIGAAAGAVKVEARATLPGPVVGSSGDIIGIDTPTGGLAAVNNVLDAVIGRNTMKDPELRQLRAIELARPGTGTPNALRVAVLDLGATSATVFVNRTDSTDVDGVPPHSFELVVQGGVDQDIFDAIIENAPNGIRSHGSVVGSALDSAGVSQVAKFSRVAEVVIYVSVSLVKDPTVYPADGDAQVAAAIANGGNAKPDGADVVSSAVLARVFAVPGVISVSLPLLSAYPVTVPVSSSTIAISLRQRAVFDTSRVAVSSTDGVP
jgi:uncharacterized phage protein gp47/JayE